MATYSTPGVYIEEIAKFPPSVAQVETAIPAFIGYTEKATNKNKGDLKGLATRITSMLEYETYFGFAKPETDIAVSVVEDVISITKPATGKTASPFLMYYSLQLYFANGGGPCYIVSIGRYGDDLDTDDVAATAIANTNALNDGLKIIEKIDEPTLLLFPDATSVTDTDAFYGLYQNALLQCNKLQDRFTIIDTNGYDNTSIVDPNIEALRNGITLGKDFKKYGAAYYPFVETILDFLYNDVDIQVTASSSKSFSELINASAASFTSYTSQLISAKTALTGVTDTKAKEIKTDITAITKNVDKLLKSTITSIDAVVTAAGAEPALGAIVTKLNALKTSLGISLTTSLNKLKSATTQANILKAVDTNADSIFKTLGINEADMSQSTILKAISDNIDSSDMATLNVTLGDQATVESKIDCPLNDLESFDNSLYNRIKSEIGQVPVVLPPSSAMAGVYARVDNNRGVWKAPANVGLNYVIKPTVHISHEEQQTLNIHTTGKSINAIRTFAGKGTLVWGARTLTGNDNEWRYVSVRRFFNFAEESIKKATEQFVFEPNDANTWVKVKAMITNFLNLQWRAGALAGATPDQAFYVNVGLGETMTAQDILEGYMFVEIGMAVVRPAEFIILKFSHKMQEA